LWDIKIEKRERGAKRSEEEKRKEKNNQLVSDHIATSRYLNSEIRRRAHGALSGNEELSVCPTPFPLCSAGIRLVGDE
jgi:hypothetical protein